MTVTTTAAPRTVDEIVAGLKDHVWTLIRAQQVDAAMVLLASELDEYLAATAPKPALEGNVVVTGAELAVIAERAVALMSR